MGLPASSEGGERFRRARIASLAGALWPLLAGRRVLVFVAAVVWRAPERVLPWLRHQREIDRCGREIDRAIAAARRHQFAACEGDAPFAGPAPSSQLGAIVLAFPRSLRKGDLRAIAPAPKQSQPRPHP